MNTIERLLNQPWVVRAGWALVHFLWQGTLIAGLFAAVRFLAGRALSARARYLLACLTLVLATITPALTFLALRSSSDIPQPLWRISQTSWTQTLPWLVVAWFGGVIIFSIRLIGGWRFTQRLRTAGTGEVPADWRSALVDLSERMGVGRPVRLLASSLVTVPTVIGWLRPAILLPVESLLGLPLAQVRALLAHELAHIRRHDYLVNMLQSVAEALLFYHPAIWWLSHQIRGEREACCDDEAVEVCGDLLVYVKALVDLESRRRTGVQLAVAADGGSLLYRVRRLIGAQQPAHVRPAPGAAWVLTILWMAGIGAVTLHGAPTSPAARRPFTPPASSSMVARAALLPEPPRVRTRAASPALAALLFDPFLAPLQAPPSPIPGTDKPAKIRVQGKVVGPSQQPLKKASVRLQMSVLARNPGETVRAYSEITDDEGKFTIEDVAPGEYTLAATKQGFLAGRYGARSPTGPGATVKLKEGTDLKDLEITLSPQGTVSGRITDSDGEPVPGAAIHLSRATYSGGQRSIARVRISQTTTNVQGRYTVQDVPPGHWYVAVDPPREDVDDPTGKEMTTYYPKALHPEDSVALDVAPGSRITGIDIQVRREKAYVVSGKAMSNGSPVKNARLVFLEITPGNPQGREVTQAGTGDGAFRYSNVLPGTYALVVAAGRVVTDPVYPPMSGRLDFTVKDRDLDGLVLALTPGIELSGGFTLEDGDWSSVFNQPGASASRPVVTLEADVPWLGAIPAKSHDDGAFQLDPVPAGTYHVRVSSLPPGAYVKSMIYGSHDVSREPIELTGNADTLRIVVSRKAATLSGTLRDPRNDGAPLPGVLVTVWPKNPSQSLAAGGAISAMTDQNGAFQFSNLAPGEYFAAAWEELDPGLDRVLDFLAGFARDPVTVSESSQQTIDVRLIGRQEVADQVAKLR